MNKGTLGRIYGGNPELVHVPDGMRTALGQKLAKDAENSIRMVSASHNDNARYKESYQYPLCPGCYMVVGFNMMVTLASRNGQSITEMARSMKEAFAKLERCSLAECIEEIEVLLDPCEEDATCNSP